MKKCWECDITGVPLHNHHPVPRSRGGTRTIPLCEPCHSKAHHRKKNMNTSALVKEGMARAKARGVVFGNPNIKSVQHLGAQSQRQDALEYLCKVSNIFADLEKTGYVTPKELLDQLNANGFKTRTGKDWGIANVYRMLKLIKEKTGAIYIKNFAKNFPNYEEL